MAHRRRKRKALKAQSLSQADKRHLRRILKKVRAMKKPKPKTPPKAPPTRHEQNQATDKARQALADQIRTVSAQLAAQATHIVTARDALNYNTLSAQLAALLQAQSTQR